MNTTKFGCRILLLASIAFSSSAFAIAGKFQFVNGEVQVLDASGKARVAKKGDAIDQGETVASGTNGFAQIKMEDGGFFAVRPDTEFKIDTFKYEGKEDGSEKGVFSLIKGSLRSVTGVVGKKNKDNYKINTATATIGIRGSGADVGHSNRLGTAVRTLFGGHSLTSGGRTVNTNPGQTALAPPGETPRFVANFPFSTSTAGGGNNNSGGNEGGGGGNTPGNTNNGTPDNTPVSANDDNVVIPIVDADGKLNLTTQTQNGGKIGESSAGPLGSGGAAAFLHTYFDEYYEETVIEPINEFNVVGNFTDFLDWDTYSFSSTVDANGNLIGWKSTGTYNGEGTYTESFVANLGSAQVIRDGSDSDLGVVWGRWTEGYTLTASYSYNNGPAQTYQLTPQGGLSFITGSYITTLNDMVALGPVEATYTLSAGNFPTLVNGVASGSITSASALVNFSSLHICNLSVAGSGGSASFNNWNVSGSGSIAQFMTEGISLEGSHYGNATGGFVGKQAQGMISTIHVTDEINNLTGAMLLKRGALTPDN